MNRSVILLIIMVIGITAHAQHDLNEVKHKVEKGQTLYFLSKKYDISIEDIMRFNPQIGKDMIVKEGLVINLYSKPMPKLETSDFKYHTVEKGQTLYSLSKQYNISIDDLIYLNQLENPNIGLGDKLIVQNVNADALYNNTSHAARENIPNDEPSLTSNPKDKVDSAKDQVSIDQFEKGNVVKEMNKEVELFKMLYSSYAESGAKQKLVSGIGNFLEQSASRDVYLALVDNIPSGQVIRVRNLMNNKVIYLKVIGSVPQQDKSNNISIKISKAAARDLKIVEDRFLAEWTWYQKDSKPATDFKSNRNIEITDF